MYKILKKKKLLVLDNYQNYIIGIAKKKIQKYYGLLYKAKISSNVKDDNNQETKLEIPANLDIEAETIEKLDAEKVWKYIKQKDIIIFKVFYLYYFSELKISQIAEKLDMNESNVKNILYRTIKDIRKNVKLEGDIDV